MALDFKGLPYQSHNLIPGFHFRVIRKLSKSTAVPLLTHGDQVIQGSAAIIDYLEALQPQPALNPVTPEQAQSAIAWEQRFDAELGPATRVFAYHYLLDRPDILVPWLTTGAPFYSRWLFRALFPKIAKVMRKKMRINADNADKCRLIIEGLLQEICSIYRSGNYLAGDTFSRADLAACALLAPLFMPTGYGIEWGPLSDFPAEMQTWLQTHKHELDEVAAIYQKHRLD
ncbi:glutathione S-transferase family protein [Nitrincola sp. A-D6]|uniref:glutathione S-transferase family protein n=1 Tax=Nitrincola sp. A-D6 TaxID=1545442 RepID=UPI00068D54B6|nr:glutathione S-transferase N-terminal domain-containing protein [Nitrincola sp. A-D6]